MSSHVDIEIRPEHSMSPRQRAEWRDSCVREFERQWADWVSIAKICSDVERDKDYLTLGFTSWHAWLLNAAPRSRSYLYLVIGRYKELSTDISDDELALIPLGSAGILRKLSSSVRRSPAVRKAATQTPQRFAEELSKIEPNQMIEPIIEKRLRFSLSQWGVVESAYEAYKLIDETAALEDFIEWLVSETREV